MPGREDPRTARRRRAGPGPGHRARSACRPRSTACTATRGSRAAWRTRLLIVFVERCTRAGPSRHRPGLVEIGVDDRVVEAAEVDRVVARRPRRWGRYPRRGELPQCHHTYCVSSSAPGWLRHSVASNWRPIAMLISVLWSGTGVELHLDAGVLLHHLLHEHRVLRGRRVGGVVEREGQVLAGLLLVLRRARPSPWRGRTWAARCSARYPVDAGTERTGRVLLDAAVAQLVVRVAVDCVSERLAGGRGC